MMQYCRFRTCRVHSLHLFKSSWFENGIDGNKLVQTMRRQADIFQVPRLISLFGIKPILTSLLVFKKGQLVDKKEV